MASDPESVNFLDLACLFKIGEDTTLERFGSVINASVFDAANITGSLKQKGLIDFTAYYPGPNSIVVTDAGKKLKADAEAKGAEPLDGLDDEILKQMSGGKRLPAELRSTLNIRAKDLAFRIYKLYKQSLLSYELKNGNVELMLTEQGFLKAKPAQAIHVPIPPTQNVQTAPATKIQGVEKSGMAVQQDTGAAEIGQMASELKKPKRGKGRMVAAAVIVIVIVVAAVYYLSTQGLLPFTL